KHRVVRNGRAHAGRKVFYPGHHGLFAEIEQVGGAHGEGVKQIDKDRFTVPPPKAPAHAPPAPLLVGQGRLAGRAVAVRPPSLKSKMIANYASCVSARALFGLSFASAIKKA